MRFIASFTRSARDRSTHASTSRPVRPLGRKPTLASALALSLLVGVACSAEVFTTDPAPAWEYTGLWRDLDETRTIDRVASLVGFEILRQNRADQQLVDLEIGGLPGEAREVAGAWRPSTNPWGENDRVHFDLDRPRGDQLVQDPSETFLFVVAAERADGFELVDLEISRGGGHVSGVWHPGVARHDAVFDLTYAALGNQVAARAGLQTLVDVEVYGGSGAPRFAALFREGATAGTGLYRVLADEFRDFAAGLFDSDLRPVDLEIYIAEDPSGTDDDLPLTLGGSTGTTVADSPDLVRWVVGIWELAEGPDWFLSDAAGAEWWQIVQRDTELVSRPVSEGGPLAMADLDLLAPLDGSGAEPMPLHHDASTGDADP